MAVWAWCVFSCSSTPTAVYRTYKSTAVMSRADVVLVAVQQLLCDGSVSELCSRSSIESPSAARPAGVLFFDEPCCTVRFLCFVFVRTPNTKKRNCRPRLSRLGLGPRSWPSCMLSLNADCWQLGLTKEAQCFVVAAALTCPLCWVVLCSRRRFAQCMNQNPGDIVEVRYERTELQFFVCPSCLLPLLP